MTDSLHNDVKHRLKELAIEEIQDGAKGAESIASQYNSEYRRDAVLEGNEGKLLTAEEATTVFDEMVMDDLLERVDDPEGWYQLADWDDRPLRVLSVSQHLIDINGMDQTHRVWLNESIRAARYEIGVDKPELRGDPAPDDRCRYQIFLRGSGVLEQYRETLTSLARDIQQSNPEKATVYRRLADAINITEPAETVQREIPLLS